MGQSISSSQTDNYEGVPLSGPGGCCHWCPPFLMWPIMPPSVLEVLSATLDTLPPTLDLLWSAMLPQSLPTQLPQLSLLCPISAPGPAYHPAPAPYHEEAPKNYQFGYDVHGYDEYGNPNVHSRTEQRDGYNVKGQYRVELPDCRVQIVDYFVDEYKQYHADVKYEGVPCPDKSLIKHHAPAPAYAPAPAPAYAPVPAPAYAPAPAYHA